MFIFAHKMVMFAICYIFGYIVYDKYGYICSLPRNVKERLQKGRLQTNDNLIIFLNDFRMSRSLFAQSVTEWNYSKRNAICLSSNPRGYSRMKMLQTSQFLLQQFIPV